MTPSCFAEYFGEGVISDTALRDVSANAEEDKILTPLGQLEEAVSRGAPFLYLSSACPFRLSANCNYCESDIPDADDPMGHMQVAAETQVLSYEKGTVLRVQHPLWMMQDFLRSSVAIGRVIAQDVAFLSSRAMALLIGTFLRSELPPGLYHAAVPTVAGLPGVLWPFSDGREFVIVEAPPSGFLVSEKLPALATHNAFVQYNEKCVRDELRAILSS